MKRILQFSGHHKWHNKLIFHRSTSKIFTQNERWHDEFDLLHETMAWLFGRQSFLHMIIKRNTTSKRRQSTSDKCSIQIFVTVLVNHTNPNFSTLRKSHVFIHCLSPIKIFRHSFSRKANERERYSIRYGLIGVDWRWSVWMFNLLLVHCSLDNVKRNANLPKQ